jgi:hypothetical protein
MAGCQCGVYVFVQQRCLGVWWLSICKPTFLRGCQHFTVKFRLKLNINLVSSLRYQLFAERGPTLAVQATALQDGPRNHRGAAGGAAGLVAGALHTLQLLLQLCRQLCSAATAAAHAS